MNDTAATTVNHHADFPGFAGVAGFLAGAAMAIMGRSKARLAVDMADISAADHVVDIGCGPGSAVRAAAQRGARVIGVDPAPVMLQLARILTRNQAGITWSLGAAEDVPVPDGSATVVWSLATVHHWKDVDAGLAETCRVLGPGGRFLAIERQIRPGATGLASHGWTEQQVESFAARCRAAGFDGVRIAQHRAGRSGSWVVQGTRPTDLV